MTTIERIKLPEPDTHCFDDDTKSDVWSYSRELVISTVLAHIDKLEAEVERLRKDAERYRWLAKYLVSDDESHDDAIVAATTVAGLDYVIDAAMKGTP